VKRQELTTPSVGLSPVTPSHLLLIATHRYAHTVAPQLGVSPRRTGIRRTADSLTYMCSPNTTHCAPPSPCHATSVRRTLRGLYPQHNKAVATVYSSLSLPATTGAHPQPLRWSLSAKATASLQLQPILILYTKNYHLKLQCYCRKLRVLYEITQTAALQPQLRNLSAEPRLFSKHVHSTVRHRTRMHSHLVTTALYVLSLHSIAN
jgi:hypothetical protein